MSIVSRGVVKALALIVLGTATAAASARVVDFEDLAGSGFPAASGTLADGYGGIAWSGQWHYYGEAQYPYDPSSGVERIYPDYSDAASPNLTHAAFSFAAPVVFDGASFAGQAVVGFELSYRGVQVAVTDSQTVTYVPTWMASDYSGLVDKVTVVGIRGSYVVDDITYQPSPVPEPASAAMALGGLLLLGAMRRRRRGER